MNVVVGNIMAYDLTDAMLEQAQRPIPPQVAAHHIAGSVLLLIACWLDQEMLYPLHQMAKIYERLITNATLNAVQDMIIKADTHVVKAGKTVPVEEASFSE